MTSTAAFYLLQVGGGSAPSPLFQLGLQFALILAIFYFLMIRPQQKQRKQHEESLRNLQKGDEIVTTGGIIGRVIYIRESMKDGVAVKSMDDQVTIKSDESRLIVERGRIARVTSAKRAEATASTTSPS
ncbi:MAG TPA: preprotein translocase subunit YajC [Gemmatimonadaceae bacterium]|nr:preprotein translocase subunit YajC [Gemmatimonadaceae bacterium]